MTIYTSDSIDSALPIGNSPFTIGWLLDALSKQDEFFQRTVSSGALVTKINTVQVGKETGFISTVLNVSLHFDHQTEPYSVILKVPECNALADVMSVNSVKLETEVTDSHIAEIHNRECDFYTKFAPNLDIPLPKVFKSVNWDVGEQRGALLMESFVGRSAALGYDATFNSDQLFNMARYLAKLHKYFLCLPEEDWKGKYSTDILEWFSEADFFEPCFEKLKIYRPGVFDEGIRVFGKYGKNKKFLRYTAYGVYKDIGLPAVLTHGDMWPNNLLWKTNADGAVSNDLAAIIDWQSIHEGSMTADIARILVMCTDGHIRREYQYKVLQYYYDTLLEELKAEGKSLEVTFEQITRAYRANFVLQSISQMIIGPFAFPDRDWTEQEAAVNEPKLDRILKRAKEAMDDGLELLKELPLEKFQ